MPFTVCAHGLGSGGYGGRSTAGTAPDESRQDAPSVRKGALLDVRGSWTLHLMNPRSPPGPCSGTALVTYSNSSFLLVSQQHAGVPGRGGGRCGRQILLIHITCVSFAAPANPASHVRLTRTGLMNSGQRWRPNVTRRQPRRGPRPQPHQPGPSSSRTPSADPWKKWHPDWRSLNRKSTERNCKWEIFIVLSSPFASVSRNWTRHSRFFPFFLLSLQPASPT